MPCEEQGSISRLSWRIVAPPVRKVLDHTSISGNPPLRKPVYPPPPAIYQRFIPSNFQFNSLNAVVRSTESRERDPFFVGDVTSSSCGERVITIRRQRSGRSQPAGRKRAAGVGVATLLGRVLCVARPGARCVTLPSFSRRGV